MIQNRRIKNVPLSLFDAHRYPKDAFQTLSTMVILVRIYEMIKESSMSSPMPIETTVFRSGNSQAIRIPKVLRLDSEKVWIARSGDTLRIFQQRPSAMDIIDSITDGLPDGWADGFTEPEELPFDDVPAWE